MGGKGGRERRVEKKRKGRLGGKGSGVEKKLVGEEERKEKREGLRWRGGSIIFVLVEGLE